MLRASDKHRNLEDNTLKKPTASSNKKITLSKALRKNFTAIMATIGQQHIINPNAQKSAFRSAILIRAMANLLRQHNHPDASHLNAERTALLQIYAVVFQSTTQAHNRHDETKQRMLKLLNQYGVSATDLTFLDKPANGNDTPSIFRQLFDDTCVLLTMNPNKPVNIDELKISQVITHDPMAKTDLNKLLADYGQLVVDLGLLRQTPRLIQNGRDVSSALAASKRFQLNGDTFDCMHNFVKKNGRFPTLKNFYNRNNSCSPSLVNFSLFWFQNQLAAKFFLTALISKDPLLATWEQMIPEKYQKLYSELKAFLDQAPEAQNYLVALQSLPARSALVDFTQKNPQFFQTLNPLLSNVRFNTIARNWNLYFMSDIFEQQLRRATYDRRINLGALMQTIMPPVTDPTFLCSIQRSPMVDPVYLGDAATGQFDEIHPFDRVNIKRWLQNKNSNPFSNVVLAQPILKPVLQIATELQKMAESAKERFLPCNAQFNRSPFSDTIVAEMHDDLATLAWIQIKFNLTGVDYQKMLGMITNAITDDKTRLLMIMSHPALFEVYANQPVTANSQGYGSQKLFQDMHTAGLIPTASNQDRNNITPFFSACETMPWLADCCLSRTRFWPVLSTALENQQISHRFIFGEQAKISVLQNIVRNAIHHKNTGLLHQVLGHQSAFEALRTADPVLASSMNVALQVQHSTMY